MYVNKCVRLSCVDPFMHSSLSILFSFFLGSASGRFREAAEQAEAGVSL